MELTAVLEALTELDQGTIEINSDSTYVVNCFRDRWYEGWLARDWKTSQRKPVANRDLWEPLVERVLARPGEVSFRWVKGHSGNEMNDLADQLAVEAMNRHRNRLPAEGPTLSASSGSSASSAQALEVPWPSERAIVVTGNRRLDANQIELLEEALAELDSENDVVVSGLRLGAELTGAEMARRAGIPVAVVLPYPEPARAWPPSERSRFDALTDEASWVITLDLDPDRPGPSIRARNQWLWEAAVGAIVVGDKELAREAELAGLGVIDL